MEVNNMVDANAILGMLGDSGRLSANQIADMVSQKSPIPVPGAVVQGLLDQLVQQGKIQKTEENGEVFYHL
jgi:Fe2+ or Zn2+ uptake regulation protein